MILLVPYQHSLAVQAVVHTWSIARVVIPASVAGILNSVNGFMLLVWHRRCTVAMTIKFVTSWQYGTVSISVVYVRFGLSIVS